VLVVYARVAMYMIVFSPEADNVGLAFPELEWPTTRQPIKHGNAVEFFLGSPPVALVV
jgi:hypothetical protein